MPVFRTGRLQNRMLSLVEFRRVIRRGNRGWRSIHENDWPDCGPCGAIAQAQMVLGYGDRLVWCETRMDEDDEWYSHWTVKRRGVVQDVSGCFLACPSDLVSRLVPRYRMMTEHAIKWPQYYTQNEVNYWVKLLRRAEIDDREALSCGIVCQAALISHLLVGTAPVMSCVCYCPCPIHPDATPVKR